MVPLDNYLVFANLQLPAAWNHKSSFDWALPLMTEKKGVAKWMGYYSLVCEKLFEHRQLLRKAYEAYRVPTDKPEYLDLNNGELTLEFRQALVRLFGEEAPDKLHYHFLDISYVEDKLLNFSGIFSQFPLTPLPLSAATCYAVRARMDLLSYAEQFAKLNPKASIQDEVFYTDFVLPKKQCRPGLDLLLFPIYEPLLRKNKTLVPCAWTPYE